MNSFQAFSLSEALTFGVGFICNAFRSRESRDEPFSAERPFSTGADVETEHGGASSVTVICRTLEPRVDGQRTPNT